LLQSGIVGGCGISLGERSRIDLLDRINGNHTQLRADGAARPDGRNARAVRAVVDRPSPGVLLAEARKLVQYARGEVRELLDQIVSNASVD
jgi:hypothetical protein